ncbi:3-hydroxyisobutyrate dehydrogenase [Gordonia sp. (in: high G+C Gram-positive bacteria)]|uniref:3-hydroxyisobutyrate dehydrogenase n=1 Tax=Gordonia sp. (in: high G+C Gram-positive bacteria) TaxID=84139 RepID=UPI0016B0B337|nr:3-hydroxyisobutyrate dehydrogenase [Gordonia sp. (in: high G+C Gram-positive bacteria)]NLG45984.1 3-hydroxyisobutyrate dehydrogenase [Gordonia sp. (in: high G+C Gram-positive bacteria)]
MSTIAFLGLGHMGGPMAANLVKGGHDVVGFDLVQSNLDTAVAAGVRAASSAEEAVSGADAVITMLPSGAAVKSVYDAVLPHATPGQLFIDSSTISVEDARAVHKQAVDVGLMQLDAPVSGGVKGATAGTLAFMVGGDTAALAAARPILAPMAGKVVACGGSGNGQAAKLCNNMILAVQQIAVGEAFALAEKLGLEDQALYDVVTGATGNCWALQTNCPVPGPVETSPANNEFRPGFATALMNKDLHLAMDAIGATGATAPLGSHAAKLYDEFAAENGGLDFSAIIETLR